MSRRLLGAVSLVAAGGMAVVGTFLPLFWEGSTFEGDAMRFTVTSWEYSDDRSASADLVDWQSPQYGVPVVVSAVLLGIAAVLVWLPEAQRLAARYVAIAATGLLAGSVATTGAVVASALANGPPAEITSYEVGAGEGMWVLGGAVLLAVTGVVLVHTRRAAPSPEGAVVYRVDDGSFEDEDMDTPPFGIPVQGVEVARIPESEYERRSDPPSGAP